MQTTELAAPAHPRTWQRSWNDSFATPAGGAARRRTRRTEGRAAAKAVKVANRRRFNSWESQRHATSTLISQVRIYSGEIGTPRQRDRVTAEFTGRAKTLGQNVDDVVAALRDGLGLDA